VYNFLRTAPRFVSVAEYVDSQSFLQVFCTPTGRTIDLATVLCQESGLLAVVSPGQHSSLHARLEKHIFPMDNVEVSDVTPHTR
jgi:folate-binding Fe-S cluster repair protein YgfZ